MKFEYLIKNMQWPQTLNLGAAVCGRNGRKKDECVRKGKWRQAALRSAAAAAAASIWAAWGRRKKAQ